ncbi:MAG: 50S ribosomal protein L4 [Microgenomates group bacterium]
MPKIDLLTINGEKAGTLNLPKEIFAAEINPQLMAQAVRVYLANQRKAYPKTKTRAEVNRTKAKWYRQKGTGRARHGSRAAPIFVGGGVAHGPKGNQNYKLKMPKKMRQAALFSALTSKFKNGDILVVKGLEKIAPKTKKIAETLEKLKVKGSKIILVLPKNFQNLILAARNIENLKFVLASSLNTYEVLASDKLIFLPEGIKKLKEVFLKNES